MFFSFLFFFNLSVQCPVLNTIVNGNVTLTSSGAESVSAYYCFPGYTLTGDQSRICTQGTWNGTQPECCKHYVGVYVKDVLECS